MKMFGALGCFNPLRRTVVEVGAVPTEPHRPIKETVLKKGGYAENFIRPKPLNAKPGDIIIVTPLRRSHET